MQQQPHFFNDITIRVGDPIDVSDLIAKHEDEHGPLWKYSEAKARGGAGEVVSGARRRFWIPGPEMNHVVQDNRKYPYEVVSLSRQRRNRRARMRAYSSGTLLLLVTFYFFFFFQHPE